VQDAVENIRETLDEFDPEELLSVAEETAHELRRKVPVEDLRGRAAECIKGQPLQAVGVAFIGGLLVGALVARLAAAPVPRTGDSLVS
jgi:ElaB/YqjD/DUF883 family membrane-anchored ribosome-binding protein